MRVLIRPSSTISNNISGGGAIGGAGTAHGVVSDSNMKSYLRTNHTFPGTLTRFGMETYTLLPNQRFAGVRTKASGGQTHPLGWAILLNNNSNMGFGFWTSLPFPATTSALVFRDSPWFYKNAATAAEWTQANIDALEAYVLWQDPSGNHDARIHEMAVELWILEKPVTSNIGPASGSIAQTNTPRFSWSFFQEDNFRSPRQVGFELKVWTKAVAEDLAFDPETSAYVVRAVKPGVSNNYFDLNNSGLPELTYGAEYYWGVKAYNLFSNGSTWYSDWSQPTPFTVNSPPVTDVTAPTGTITTTNQPPTVWTYTDPDGQAIQDRFQLKIWKRPGGSWAGFDPDTTVLEPVFQIEALGDATTQTTDVRLDNTGVYRSYVRTAQAVQDFPPFIYGAWDFSEFTISLTQPATPSISASYVDSDYVGLLVTPAAPGSPSVEHFEVERSLDNGVTWNNFRYGGGGSALSNLFLWGAGAPFGLVDHEVPYGVFVKYRAFSVDTTLGTKVYSQPSAEVTAIVKPQAIWLKHPTDSTKNQKFPITEGWLSSNNAKARSVSYALGRTLPLVVRGKSGGKSFTATFLITGQDLHDAFWELMDADVTLFIQTPKVSCYADVSGNIDEAAHLWDDRAGEDPVWTFSVPFTEVEY